VTFSWIMPPCAHLLLSPLSGRPRASTAWAGPAAALVAAAAPDVAPAAARVPPPVAVPAPAAPVEPVPPPDAAPADPAVAAPPAAGPLGLPAPAAAVASLEADGAPAAAVDLTPVLCAGLVTITTWSSAITTSGATSGSAARKRVLSPGPASI